jgi:hypothetical protein
VGEGYGSCVVPKTKIWTRWLDEVEVQYLDADWDLQVKWAELQKLEGNVEVDDVVR